MGQTILIYTDGSCLGNPGPGGWSAILELQGSDYRRELGGGFRKTTNNRMELLAAINALEALRRPCAAQLHTDSLYLANAIEKGWLANWQNRGWRKADKSPVPNADLWRRLLPLLTMHSVRFAWIRGHNGHPQNERCDELARQWAARSQLPPDAGYEDGLVRG